MDVQAFISGLNGSITEVLLPTLIAGAWVIFILATRHRWRQTPTPEIDLSADPGQAVSSRLAWRAADQIDFDLGRVIMPPGYGKGRNLRTVSTSRRVEHYEDFEPGTHDPHHIDPLESHINPLRIPQVGMKRESHKEKLLVVVDATNINPGGSPNDYVDELKAMKAVAETIILAATKRKFPTGVLGPRGNQHVYQRPGSTRNQLVKAVELIRPTSDQRQVKAFHQEVQTKSQNNAKGLIVISTFQDQKSQALTRRLSRRPRLFAIQISGEWNHQFGRLPKKVAVDIGDGQTRPVNLANFQPRFAQKAKLWQAVIDRTLKPDFRYLEIHRDKPDIPGQLVKGLRKLAA